MFTRKPKAKPQTTNGEREPQSMLERTVEDLRRDPIASVASGYIVGSTAVPWWPPMPDGNPWAEDILPNEPTLDHNINDLEE